MLDTVLTDKRPFDDDALAAAGGDALETRDRAFARLIAVTVLRRLGQIDAVLTQFLKRAPAGKQAHALTILRVGAAQLMFLGTPAHAAVGLAVEQVRKRTELRGLDGLANAVLRRVAQEGPALLATLDGVRLDTPRWLWTRWVRAYGEETARHMAEASLCEATLDLSVAGDAPEWARRLGGVLLPTGSIRLEARGRIEDLAGFADGAWWVQDAAAALPVRLMGDVSSLRVADLCAAPGGKTAQLANAGAIVTAVDLSPARVKRLKANLARLRIAADVVEADVESWQPPQLFDAVLLDAPCSATGTIRRHPDLPRIRTEADVASLAERQARLMDAAARLVQPGGRLVYCVCSLEPEEGVQQIAAFLARNGAFSRIPLAAGTGGIGPEMFDAQGNLRTMPFHMQPDGVASGCDGFFAAVLRHKPA